jgi:gliding motility-associated-like protein
MNAKYTPPLACSPLAGVLKKAVLFLAFFMLQHTILKAQPIPCPPNIDYETGTFLNWLLFNGSCSGGSNNAAWIGPAAPVATEHTIMSGNAQDLYGNGSNFPVVAPGGGTYSLKLNNKETGARCDRARYFIHIPNNQDNYSFIYKYAVVLENPAGHSYYEQPSFQIHVYDSVTLDTVPCSARNYVADPALLGLGFLTSNQLGTGGSTVYYLPWATGSINLSGQGGHTIVVDFEAYDCALSGHMGYAYVDVVSCGTYNAVLAACNLAGSGVTLSAPPGYQTYTWYNSSWTQVVGTGQIVNTPAPYPCDSFNVVLVPFQGVGCPDTLHTGKMCDIQVDASPDTICYKSGVPVQLNATVQGGLPPVYTVWSGNGLSCDTCLNHIAAPFGNHTYIVKTSDSNGCWRADTLSFIESNFDINAGDSFITCIGTPVTLTASVTPATGNYTYTWTPNSGLSNANALTPSYTPTSSLLGTQTYILTVDSGNCSKVDSITITTLPDNFIVTDTTLCKGDPYQMIGSGSDSFKYSWTPTIGLSDSTIVNPLINIDTTTVYTVTASYPTCPSIVKTVTIAVQPVPLVSIGPDTSKCQWEVLPLNAQITPSWYNQYSYQWSPNPGINTLTDPHILFTGQQDAQLILTVKTPKNCVGRDSINIVVHQGNFAAISPVDTAICPNNTIAMSITGGTKYDWTPGIFLSDSSVANPISSPVTNVDYVTVVYDQYGCKDTVYSSIRIHSDALVGMDDSVTIYPGEEAQLNPRGNALYYKWWPPTGLDYTNVSNPIAKPDVSTRYYVEATTEYGCKVQDSIDVVVVEESLLNVPNAFTPGSAPNEILKINRRGDATLKYFRIYNRWGTKVFETTDINEGWDGKYKGSVQPMGVYIYMIDATTQAGKHFYKQGNVTLIR